MKVPSLDYDRLVRALTRDGWLIVRQRGSHIRLQRQVSDKVQKLTAPEAKAPTISSPVMVLFLLAAVVALRRRS